MAYQADEHWVYHARQALASMSRVWGGAGGVVLPVGENGTVPASLLPLLRLYDPDLVAGHVQVVADLEVVAPQRATELKQAYSQQPGANEQELGQLMDEPLPGRSWGELAAVINAWCSPFKGVDQSKQYYSGNRVGWLHRKEPPPRDLTLLPASVDDRILTLDLDGVDPLITLMIETRVGSAVDDGSQGRVLPLRVTRDDVSAFVQMAITGLPQLRGWDPHSVWAQAREQGEDVPQPPADLTAEEFLDATPMARARRWTVKVQTGEVPVVCVVGSTAEDHALAVLSDRLFHHGAWVPRMLLEREARERNAARLAMHSVRRLPGAPDRPVLITTASRPFSDVERIVAELNEFLRMFNTDGTPVSGEPKFRAITPGELADESDRCFLADPTAFGTRQRVPMRDLDGELSILTPLQLPLPEVAGHLEEARWCIDVSVGGYVAPPRTALSSRALQDTAGQLPEAIVRAGQHGLTYGSANMGFVMAGAPPEARRAHPLLRFPTVEQIFTDLAAARGATVRRSDAGRRASIAVELWGSLDAVLADLNGPVRRLLKSFLPDKGKRNGSYAGGYAIRGDGYLNFTHAVKALALLEEDARTTLDRLLVRRIIHRGLILTCARCRWQSFVAAEALGPSSFTCGACSHRNTLTAETWDKNEREPLWHYSLDQVIRELLRQNGDVPLLAVDYLRESHRAVLWSPELAVTMRRDTVELDIAVIVDGRIIVGEAKSNGKLGDGKKNLMNSAKRLVAAAKTLSADQIVIATATPSWTSGTSDGVHQHRMGERPPATRYGDHPHRCRWPQLGERWLRARLGAAGL